MPADSQDTVPVLVHMDRQDWEKFKEKVGQRQASYALRQLVRRDLAEELAATTR